MTKAFMAALSMAFVAFAYAGSCDDCLTTFNEHKDACREDKACEQRAFEAFKRCTIGCTKN